MLHQVICSTQGVELALLQEGKVGASMKFSHDGKVLATLDDDDTVRLWQVGGMKEMLVLTCDWVRPYLESKPKGDEDRHWCDGIGSRK